jgi:hypothetical protein
MFEIALPRLLRGNQAAVQADTACCSTCCALASDAGESEGATRLGDLPLHVNDGFGASPALVVAGDERSVRLEIADLGKSQ